MSILGSVFRSLLVAVLLCAQLFGFDKAASCNWYRRVKTTMAEVPAKIMATSASCVLYPLVSCAYAYRLTAVWLAFWRDTTICTVLMAYWVIASIISAHWGAVAAALHSAAAVLNFVCDSRAMANTIWLHIKDTSSSQSIRVCTLVINKGAAYIDRHSEEPIMKTLQHIYDFIASVLNSTFLKKRGWTLPVSPTARKAAERQCLQVKLNQGTQAVKTVELAGLEDFVKSCGGSNSPKFCAWKVAVLQHPEQVLQTDCSTSMGNTRPDAALAPEALERIAATLRAMQPMGPGPASSSKLEDWHDMALILQKSFDTFATEQVGEESLAHQPANAAQFNSISAGPAGIRAS